MDQEKIIFISATDNQAGYPVAPPFRPHKQFPELGGKVKHAAAENIVYDLLRSMLHGMNFDSRNFGTDKWNPFGEFIHPGQHVLVKPNLVRHIHLTGGDYQAVVTHGALVRCVLDYVALALQGSGEITVGDAPVQSGNFEKTIERTGLQQVIEEITSIWKIPVQLIDFRLWKVSLDKDHKIINSSSSGGDPKGYEAVDLGNLSFLAPLCNNNEKFRVTSYDCTDMVKHHNHKVNEYLIPRTVLEADTVINLPKLKTHRKVGLTVALKNLVGINGYKDWLPHHRSGSIKDCGDEYLHQSLFKDFQSSLSEKIGAQPKSKLLKIRRFLLRITRRLAYYSAKDPYVEGSWYGNDTLWRTVLDLNRILIYADKEGQVAKTPQRNCFTIIDGVIAGEGEGPMEPDARLCGVLIGGYNPAVIDAVAATLVGFDIRKIPLIFNAFQDKDLPITGVKPVDIQIKSQNPAWQGSLSSLAKNCLHFKPSSGWKNHIELTSG